MIVGPLKKGLNGGLPVIIVFFLLIFISSFFFVTYSTSNDSRNVVYSFLYQRVHSAWAIYFINSLSLILGTVLISWFSVQQEAVDKQNFLPPFLYLFFGALSMSDNLIHPALMANVFILLALNALTDTYRAEHALSKIFNAAIFTSVAMFFYLNYAFFILLFFIALVILRSFNWREWIVSLLGLSAPIFIYGCLGYLANWPVSVFFEHLGELLLYFQKPLLSEYYIPVLVYVLILLALSVAKHMSGGLGSKIKTQKTLSVIYWFLLLSVVNFFAKNNTTYFPSIASIIPLSVLLGDYFFNIRQLKIANTLFFLLIISGAFLFLMNLGVIRL